MTHSRIRLLRHPALALSVTALVAAGLTACGTPAGTAQHGTGRTSTTASQAPKPVRHMVSVNEHTLAFYVRPGSGPVIVLDAGGGRDASEWQQVAPVLAERTGSEVITYDRAGVGRSSDVSGPWRARHAASDLAEGLRQLGVTDGVILVSHSLAGEIATYFARNHPDQVTGAVLVDANLPPFFTADETARLVAVNEKKIAKIEAQPRTRKTRQLLAQADGYGPVHRAYHQLRWPDAVPATVIVSSETPFPTRQDAERWRAAQREFADAAPNRRLVVARHSSHDVPDDRPDVVIHAVEGSVQRAR